MTVKECYDRIGGSYDEAKKRLMTDKLMVKFLGMFLRDTSFQQITEALSQNNYEEAFKGAHSLKGVCHNMAFSALCAAADPLTEELRGKGSGESVQQLYEKTKEVYELTVQTIKEFIDSQE
jgi:HPt (histidine-containing phosphotransfer) domain-containing protein